MAPSALPAKIARPRLAAVYQRSRLFTLLDAARERCAVTFVSGPPGTGKTTLLSSYIEFRNLRCLWYQVDPGDEDVATFFRYLGRATEPHQVARSCRSTSRRNLHLVWRASAVNFFGSCTPG